ncbi:hypothetical protein FQZ97_891080 [compost metagenome]
MEAQQPLALETAQEMTALDGLGRQVDQGHGVELALPRHVMPRRGHVQHRQQFAMGIEHRAGRAGQSGMPAAKMFILVNGQRLALDQAGADAVGAFAGLAPVRTQPQTGLFEGAFLRLLGDTVEDHPTGIGQQHRMARAGQLAVQAVHLVAGNLQHLLQLFAPFQHARVLDHRRRHALRRVEAMLLQAAQPGARHGGIGSRAIELPASLGHGQHLLGVATCMLVHCYCSPLWSPA